MATLPTRLEHYLTQSAPKAPPGSVLLFLGVRCCLLNTASRHTFLLAKEVPVR